MENMEVSNFHERNSENHGNTVREVIEHAVVHEEQAFALRFLIALGILLAVLMITFSLISREGLKQGQGIVPLGVNSENAELPISHTERPMFPQVSLEADAAYVMDLVTGEVYFSKNGNAQLPLASLTKLMTVLVAADLFPRESLLTVSHDSLFGDVGTDLIPDESWLSKDLFTYTLTQSSNGGARAIASAIASLPQVTATEYESAKEVFVSRMNDTASSLELTQTYFLNETGLDETEQTGGSYGSARDVAYLMGEMVRRHPDLLEGTRHEAVALTSNGNQSHVAINTNTHIGSIPGLIGSKTGYTDLAGGNLAIAFDRGVARPVIVVVLGSSREGRFTDVDALVDATFTYLASRE